MQYSSPALKRINHLISELEQIYHQYALKYRISDSVFIVLYSLSVEAGECALSDIVLLSGLPKQTVNSAIRKMEEEEIIFLSENGKRRKNVVLTEKGREKAENSVVKLIEIENGIFSRWGEEKTERYIKETEEYNDLMRKEID